MEAVKVIIKRSKTESIAMKYKGLVEKYTLLASFSSLMSSCCVALLYFLFATQHFKYPFFLYPHQFS